jgi:hypothetical protein
VISSVEWGEAYGTASRSAKSVVKAETWSRRAARPRLDIADGDGGSRSAPRGDIGAYLAAVTDNTQPTRTTEAEFRHGTQTMSTQMASGYEPPSMSLSPAAPAAQPAPGGGVGTSPAPTPSAGSSAGATSGD